MQHEFYINWINLQYFLSAVAFIWIHVWTDLYVILDWNWSFNKQIKMAFGSEFLSDNEKEGEEE